MSDQAKKRVVLQLSGKNSPDLITLLADTIAKTNSKLVTLDHSCSGDSAWISASAEVTEATREAFESVAARHQLHFDMVEAPLVPGTTPGCSLCITLLGPMQHGVELARVLEVARELGLQPRSTRTISENRLHCLELLVQTEGELSQSQFHHIRETLLALGPELHIDLAVQVNNIYRQNKRLLCMDVDSTFVRGEFIDDLAELLGVKKEVAEITNQAMRGELDFEAALRKRVKLLKGLPMAEAKKLCERFVLTPGAEDLVKTVKQLGMRVGLVSGGFDFFVETLKERYDLDFAFANELGVEDGILTGEVVGTVVTPARKAQVLKDMAHVFAVRPEQTVAAGDGANDIDMLQAAGLGIAYQAKPRLKEVAHSRFDRHERLDTMLYLLGLDADNLVTGCGKLK